MYQGTKDIVYNREAISNETRTAIKEETPDEHFLETLENCLSFFINESINESSVSRTAHPLNQITHYMHH